MGNANSLTIVMYHYVRNLSKSKYPLIKGLEVSNFREQLKYFSKYYKFIKVEELHEALLGGRKLAKNSILLTFDDGYSDHYNYVFPILSELKIQGAFFPSAQTITRAEVLDVNKIHFILASSSVEKIIKHINLLLNNLRVAYSLESNDYYFKKLAVASRLDSKEVIFIKRLLQVELDQEVRSIIVDNLFKALVCEEEKLFASELYMSQSQIELMIKNGMYFGSHGDYHIWLNAISPQEQSREIENSLDFLERVGAPTKDWMMCYPYGGYNNDLIEILKNNNCLSALTTKVGIANIEADSQFMLPRLDTIDFDVDSNSGPCKWTNMILDDC